MPIVSPLISPIRLPIISPIELPDTPAVVFTPEAITYDGTNDVFNNDGSDSDHSSKLGIINLWLYPTSIAADNVVISNWRAGDNGFVDLQFYSNGLIEILGRATGGGSGVNKLKLRSTTALRLNTWHHLLVSWDMASSANTLMYLNDAPETLAIKTVTNEALDWNPQTMAISGRAGSLKYFGDMAEVYMTDEFLLLSTEANRRKFINADGTPADLGATGTNPTGTQPRVLVVGNAATLNAGTVGGSYDDWTMTGAVTDSSNEPVQAPNYPFYEQAVSFDRTNDYLLNDSIAADTYSQDVSLSFWVNFNGSDATMQYIHVQGNSAGSNLTINIRKHTNNKINIIIEESDDTQIVYVYSSTNYTSSSGWMHFLFSYDGSAGVHHLYTNDIEDSGSETVPTTAGTPADWDTLGRWSIGCYPLLSNGDRLDGDLAEFYITDEFIDFSVENNRRKFVKADGTPEDLGSDGSTPTTTQPRIYMTGGANRWNAGINAGSGGDFTMTGAVADSANEPIAT